MYLKMSDIQLNHNFSFSNNATEYFQFSVNGIQNKVSPQFNNVGPTTLLVDYIRDNIGLKGTKYMCREGGCGACVVSVNCRALYADKFEVRAINSCLVPIFLADGWDITTVEGIGNQKQLHPIQQNLVKFSGTQCGFCSSGMIMNMFSLTKSKPSFKMEDVENSLDGNLCRCTGYRPILDAFKSMAQNSSKMHETKSLECFPTDIEDLVKDPTKTLEIVLESSQGEIWIKAKNLQSVERALWRCSFGKIRYKIVSGNTGIGVYKNDGPYQVYIDISTVPELKTVSVKPTKIIIGSAVTLANSIAFMEEMSQQKGFAYLAQIARHLKRVANVPVRNIGTLGGNLMLKYFHREFPSDVFTLLAAAGAKLLIGTSMILGSEFTLTEFLSTNMNGQLILSIIFPSYTGTNYYFRSFKVTKRYQNSHAYVNGAIFLRVNSGIGFTVEETPKIVFGGIRPNFINATITEIFLSGKKLEEKSTLIEAMKTLEGELYPNKSPPDASPEYRTALAQAMLYKTILGIMGNAANQNLKSASLDIEYGLSSGKQVYSTTDQSQWPIYERILKLESIVQCTGEAQYINDIPPLFNELFGAFVLSSVGNATLVNVDASEALLMPGVVGFIEAKDIPGINNYEDGVENGLANVEQIFAYPNVNYAGQPIGLILGETPEIAFQAVKRVKIIYGNIKKPIIDMKDSLKLLPNQKDIKTKIELKENAQAIKGQFRSPGQYHMHMETQICICVPLEDGMNIYTSTQNMDMVQIAIALALGIPNNKINVSVRRLGGAFGAKLHKAAHTATVASVAAYITRRPVRIVLSLEDNMEMIGKRHPTLTNYQVGFDTNGVIKTLLADIYSDDGYSGNETKSAFAKLYMQNCYRGTGFEIKPGNAVTNTAPNTSCRAPGSFEGISATETMFEHVAHTLNMDPLELRIKNFIKEGDPLFESPGKTFKGENPLPNMIKDLKISGDFDKRKEFVTNFNNSNRYRKRGLSLVPMRFHQPYDENFSVRIPCFISVYHGDGTVAVSHGGIECGQGINTKVVQVVAKTLNIPINLIQAKPSNNLISPNASQTGGSVTSELACQAALEACMLLLAKMEPARRALGKDATWLQVVKESFEQHILLTAQYQVQPGPSLQSYDVWAVCLNEVEVDVLTGEYKIVRVDILEDAGYSISPDIDMGQIEGAFVMGIGVWTTEELIYDKDSGKLLTKNTWEYKPPFSKNIPQDFRVSMAQNRPNPLGILRSKATGEPPLCLSVSVIFALRNAINSARKDAGNNEWYQMDGPVTPEVVQRLSLAKSSEFEL